MVSDDVCSPDQSAKNLQTFFHKQKYLSPPYIVFKLKDFLRFCAKHCKILIFTIQNVSLHHLSVKKKKKKKKLACMKTHSSPVVQLNSNDQLCKFWKLHCTSKCCGLHNLFWLSEIGPWPGHCPSLDYGLDIVHPWGRSLTAGWKLLSCLQDFHQTVASVTLDLEVERTKQEII